LPDPECHSAHLGSQPMDRGQGGEDRTGDTGRRSVERRRPGRAAGRAARKWRCNLFKCPDSRPEMALSRRIMAIASKAARSGDRQAPGSPRSQGSSRDEATAERKVAVFGA
jgi:hypothetical protein